VKTKTIPQKVCAADGVGQKRIVFLAWAR